MDEILLAYPFGGTGGSLRILAGREARFAGWRTVWPLAKASASP